MHNPQELSERTSNKPVILTAISVYLICMIVGNTNHFSVELCHNVPCKREKSLVTEIKKTGISHKTH